MSNLIEIRWHGRGGQGAKTASLLLADAAFNTGKYIQGFPEYGPERMGAPITAYNRISTKPITIHSNIYEPDYVVERLEGEENCEQALNRCLEKWTPIQREIYQRLLKKEKKQDISRELNLTIPKLYLECNNMKRDLKSCLGLLD